MKTGARITIAPRERKLNLTPKHREVLQLIANGLQSKEIARKLSMSQRTVETHRREIRFRLGTRAGSIGHAVAIALRRGLIE